MSTVFDASGLSEHDLEVPLPGAADFVSSEVATPLDLKERLAEAREAFARLPDGIVVWDIETEPLEDEQFRELVEPFQPPPHPGVFDPSTVSPGNRKKPETIAAHVEKEREKHEQKVRDYEKNCHKAEQEYWQQQYLKATLDARLSRVSAIGFADNSGEVLVIERDEARMLHALWEAFRNAERSQSKLVGFNIFFFDLPYCLRRSWLTDVPVPPSVRHRRYWSDVLVDLYDLWSMGRPQEVGGIGGLCRAFGFRGKPTDCTGAEFWQVLRTNRKVAEAYLVDDLRMPAQLSVAMGVDAPDVVGRSPLALLRNARQGFRAKLTSQAAEAVEIASGIIRCIEQVKPDDVLQSIAAEAGEIREKILASNHATEAQRGRLLQLDAGARRLIL